MPTIVDTSLDTVDWGRPIAESPFAAGLVGAWLAVPNRAGWGTELWRDLVRNHHGTLTSMDAPTDWVTDSISPRFGSLTFDGSNDIVSVTDHADFDVGTGAFAAVVIFKTTGVSFETIFNKGNHQANDGWSIDHNGDGTLRLRLMDSAAHSANGSGTYNDGEWHTVVGTRTETGDLNLYVDGVLDGSDVSTGGQNLDQTDPLFFGRRSGTDPRYFTGSVCFGAFLNRAVSEGWAAEFDQDARRGFPTLLRRMPLMRAESEATPAGGVTVPIFEQFYRKMRSA